MRNITLSADSKLIEAAREKARSRKTTLNDEFRRWLVEYASVTDQAERVKSAIRELQKEIRTGGRRFTRDEMNER